MALVVVAVWAVVACGRMRTPVIGADAPVTAARTSSGEVRWLKGQLHAHSNRSGDSDTPPEDVLRWYGEHGFDFVVFTDHNHVTRLADSATTLAIPGIELTQNYATCDPPPPPGMQCLLHVNALFVGEDVPPPSWPPARGPTTRVGYYSAALEASEALKALPQVNHPNFQYGADATVLRELGRRGARFLEVANAAWDSNNAGDPPAHPDTEALWDAVLSDGHRVWATATDDAHHYYDAAEVKRRGEDVFTGDLGFVMVRASKDVASIRAAMERGEFYASTGALLSRVEVKDGALQLEVAPESAGEHSFTFTGEGGKELGTSKGRMARFEFAQLGAGYVRAVVTDSSGLRKAWVQPVFMAPK